MAKDNKYILYGDDNRVEQKQLEDLAEETDDLLAGSGSRRKKQSKKSSIPNVLDDIDDLDFGDDDDDGDTQEMPTIDEDDEDEDEPEEQPTKSSKKKKQSVDDQGEDKPKNLTVPIVILVVVLVVMFMIIFALLNSSSDRRGTASENFATPTEATQEETATPEPTEEATEEPEESEDSDSDVVGYLSKADKSHKYTLGETLKCAEDINSAALSYLNSLTKAVANNADDPDVSLHDQLDEKQKMLNVDIATLQSYETMFTSYSGAKYISSCEARFNNIKDMYEAALKDYPSSGSRINAVNALIDKENGLADNSKNNLKDYLDANKVQYSEDDNQLQYSY